jgi:hypothetical protein
LSATQPNSEQLRPLQDAEEHWVRLDRSGWGRVVVPAVTGNVGAGPAWRRTGARPMLPKKLPRAGDAVRR